MYCGARMNKDAQDNNMSKFGLVKEILIILLFSSGSNIDIKYLRHFTYYTLRAHLTTRFRRETK